MVNSGIAILAYIADKGMRCSRFGHLLLRSTSRMFVWWRMRYVNDVTGGCRAGCSGSHAGCGPSVCRAKESMPPQRPVSRRWNSKAEMSERPARWMRGESGLHQEFGLAPDLGTPAPCLTNRADGFSGWMRPGCSERLASAHKQ